MLEALYSAAAGMSAQQQQLDAISNDLANANTTGYEAEEVGFDELLHSEVDIAGTDTTVGAGASAQVIGRDQSEGQIQQTDDPLDLAINGEGFFQLERPNGQLALTRDGSFQVDARGQLTNAEGDRLVPPITLPKGTSPSDVTIAKDGAVRAGGRTLGRIELVTVPAPGQLLAEGGNRFAVTAASGATRAATGATIQQGALESSNVNVASEMTEMMDTQRSYQLESNAIKTDGEMLSIANNLRSS